MAVKRIRLVKKRVNRSAATTIFLFILLSVVAILMVIPFVLIVGNAFKTLEELWVFPPRLIPRNPTLENFYDMFYLLSDSYIPFSRYLFNTLFVTVTGTFGQVLLASMAAFVLSKKTFPGRAVLFQLVVWSLMFNGTVTAIPNYLIMAELKWIDTYLSLILPACASSLGLFLMKQFMDSAIPDTLLEAARIDGAGQWHIFWRLVMPIANPSWLTLILFSVQGLWGMGASPFIFDEKLKPLAYALNQISSAGVARAGVSAAISVVMLAVPIFIFIITQSNIMETMSTSGMKE